MPPELLEGSTTCILRTPVTLGAECSSGEFEEEVEYCLSQYDVKSVPARGNTVYRAVLPNGRRIKVVVEAGSIDPVKVITAA